jgi:hypothetical protein
MWVWSLPVIEEQSQETGKRANLKLLEKYMVANKQLEGEDDGKLRARIELGNRHPDFVYTVY